MWIASDKFDGILNEYEYLSEVVIKDQGNKIRTRRCTAFIQFSLG